MSDEGKHIKVVLSIPAGELESLRSFIDFSNGEIISVKQARKRKRPDDEEASTSHSENNPESAENPEQEPNTSCYALGSFAVQGAEPKSSCPYCLQTPCVTASPTKPTFLNAHGEPRAQNISKRYRDYRYFYATLKKEGLWNTQEYLDRKHELGIFIDDVREVMPNCVVNNVRGRWPNPDNIPYKGHIPIMTQNC